MAPWDGLAAGIVKGRVVQQLASVGLPGPCRLNIADKGIAGGVGDGELVAEIGGKGACRAKINKGRSVDGAQAHIRLGYRTTSKYG